MRSFQVPRGQTFMTDFHVGGITFFGVEAGISEDDHLFFILLDKWYKDLIRNIGGIGVPIGDQAPLIEHQTNFGTYNPAMIAQPFQAVLICPKVLC